MDVRIVELQPLRVASALAYGPEPEFAALRMVWEWAGERSLMDAPRRIFGFNNPGPSEGSPNYGYEVWMVVGEDVQAAPPIAIKVFGGGKYAVARVMGVEHIPGAWMDLVKWAETSPVQRGEHRWLEEHIRAGEDVPPEEMVLDLYLPIRG